MIADPLDPDPDPQHCYCNCWVFMKLFAEMGFFWLFRPMLWGEWRRRWLFWWRGCWSLRTFSRPLGPATNLRPANHRGWPTNRREPAANLQSANHRRPTTNLQWANYRRLVANLHEGWHDFVTGGHIKIRLQVQSLSARDERIGIS